MKRTPLPLPPPPEHTLLLPVSVVILVYTVQPSRTFLTPRNPKTNLFPLLIMIAPSLLPVVLPLRSLSMLSLLLDLTHVTLEHARLLPHALGLHVLGEAVVCGRMLLPTSRRERGKLIQQSRV